MYVCTYDSKSNGITVENIKNAPITTTTTTPTARKKNNNNNIYSAAVTALVSVKVNVFCWR